MFAINNEELKKNTPEWDMIQEGIDKLRTQYRWPIILDFPQHFARPNPNEPRIRKAGGSIPMTETVTRNGRKETITYYETWVGDKIGKKTFLLSTGSNRLDFTGFLALHEADIEKAYFILEYSHLRYDPVNNPRGLFIVQNKELDAKNEIATRQQQAQMSNWIDKELSTEDLLIVARSYEVNTVGVSVDEIRNDLYKKALSIGYEQFSRNKSVNKTTSTKAVIQEAIEKGIILLDKETDPTAYFGNKGQLDQVLTKIGRTKNVLDELYVYFMREDADYKKLQELLGKNEKPKAEQKEFTSKNTSTDDEYKESLKEKLKAKDIKFHHMAKVESLEALCKENGIEI